MKRNPKSCGHVLLAVLGMILVVSLIGAIVLRNSTTRLNVATNQVRAWKEALAAAESGGDIAFAEIRKARSPDPAIRASQWSGWTQSGTPPTTPTTYTSPVTTFGSNNLNAQTVVEKIYFNVAGAVQYDSASVTAPPWYRVRSRGTVPLPGLKRTGMDDSIVAEGQSHFAAIGSGAMQDITARGKGDSLLRKIDFQYDHFVATYGPKGDGLNKALVAAPSAPSISRRIEQILTPVTPFFDAAIRCAGNFRGLGNSGMLDSFDSRLGPYVFCADNPSHPLYPYSRYGSLQIGSAVATIRGMLYGDVATDGGSIVRSSQITGTIDNNVPMTLVDYQMPDTSGWNYRPPGSGAGQLPSSVTGAVNLTPTAPGSADAPTYYEISSLSGALTINPVGDQDTFVAIRVRYGDITGKITVNGAPTDPTKGAHVKIYFDYNINTANNNLANLSPIPANPKASNLQFYGISPPRNSAGNPVRPQTIELGSSTPSLLAATFYAPSADVNEGGNPDFIGTMVCKTFYANGNIQWHYDRALNDEGELIDYRVVNYVEDTR